MTTTQEKIIYDYKAVTDLNIPMLLIHYDYNMDAWCSVLIFKFQLVCLIEYSNCYINIS